MYVRRACRLYRFFISTVRKHYLCHVSSQVVVSNSEYAIAAGAHISMLCRIVHVICVSDYEGRARSDFDVFSSSDDVFLTSTGGRKSASDSRKERPRHGAQTVQTV